MRLAIHVCKICKGRKKKCDKKLPSCGYCMRLVSREGTYVDMIVSETDSRLVSIWLGKDWAVNTRLQHPRRLHVDHIKRLIHKATQRLGWLRRLIALRPPLLHCQFCQTYLRLGRSQVYQNHANPRPISTVKSSGSSQRQTNSSTTSRQGTSRRASIATCRSFHVVASKTLS